jgi:hypothetical protein
LAFDNLAKHAKSAKNFTDNLVGQNMAVGSSILPPHRKSLWRIVQRREDIPALVVGAKRRPPTRPRFMT